MAYPKNCLIIDIGNEQIKIAEVIRGTNTIKINNFDVIQTPENSINDGMLLDKMNIGNLIKATLKEQKMSCKQVVFTVSSSKIITREVELPDLKPNKLKTIVTMNASEYFPVNLNDYVLDFYIIDKVVSDGETKLKVNLVAALSSVIDEYIGLADLIGLKIAGIDYTGNSLNNFAKKEKLEGNYMLLDIGSDSTMVSIVADHVPKFNRNLLYGTSLLIDCIKSHFEVDDVEAIRISKERPLLSAENDNNPYLSSDVSTSMNQVLNGVTRLVDYYASRNQEKIATIYIVGGGANIFGVTDYVEKFFNIPTKKLEDITSAIYKGNKNFQSVSPFFANVMGAAFSDINLTPRRIAEKASVQTKIRTYFLLVCLVVISLVGIYILLSSQNSQLESRRDTLKQDIEKAQAIQEIKKQYDDLNLRAEFRKRIITESTGSSEFFVDILEKMETTIPENVSYLNIVDTEVGLEINCVARDKMTVAVLISVLKELGFTIVNVPDITESIDDTGETSVSFSVSCVYSGGEIDEQTN